MWSAACGQAAEDLEFLSHLPRRRREAPLELGVLARPLLEVRRAGPRARLGLGLEGVLLAGVLRCFEVLWVCLWLLLARRGDERVFVASGGPSPLVRVSGRAREAKLLGEPRALSRRHVWFLLRRAPTAGAAARAAFWQPWCVFRTPAATSGRVTTPCSWWLGTPRSRRQRLRLQDLSQSFAFRFRDGLVRHLSQARPEQRLADLLASNHALRSAFWARAK